MARSKPKSSKNGAQKAPLKQLSDKAICESAPAEPKTKDDGENEVDKEEQENVAEEVKTTDAGVTTQAKAVKRSQPARGNVNAQKKPKMEIEKDDKAEKAEEEPKEPSSEIPSSKPRKPRKKKKKAQQQTAKAVITQVEKKKTISPAASKPKTQQSKKKSKR